MDGVNGREEERMGIPCLYMGVISLDIGLVELVE